MEEARIGNARLVLAKGDITTQKVDAIVNAANAGLSGGGGVDGAIHRAGGPSILEECRRVGRCAVGGAVITGAGNLRARFVIHAVAPVYVNGKSGEEMLLQSAYTSSLALAEKHHLQTIAFPALGTGAYRYPMRKAAEIALATAISHLKGETEITHITFVLFDHNALEVHSQVLQTLLPR